MKCYYRIEDGKWLKGHANTHRGNLEVHFISRDENGTLIDNTVLTSTPEVLMHDSYMSVTGWVPVPDEAGQRNLYKLVSVDVSPGWVRPKD
jgi:hypothetical protein